MCCRTVRTFLVDPSFVQHLALRTDDRVHKYRKGRERVKDSDSSSVDAGAVGEILAARDSRIRWPSATARPKPSHDTRERRRRYVAGSGSARESRSVPQSRDHDRLRIGYAPVTHRLARVERFGHGRLGTDTVSIE